MLYTLVRRMYQRMYVFQCHLDRDCHASFAIKITSYSPFLHLNIFYSMLYFNLCLISFESRNRKIVRNLLLLTVSTLFDLNFFQNFFFNFFQIFFRNGYTHGNLVNNYSSVRICYMSTPQHFTVATTSKNTSYSSK